MPITQFPGTTQAIDPATGLPVTYMGNALQNPQQLPQTPIGQATDSQAPQSAQTPMGVAMASQGTQGTPGDIQGMFSTQATNPNMALNNGLIAAGSAMLGGKNLQEGMSAAGSAFSNTFDQTLSQQRDLNTPKVVPLADGAFSMVQLPGQAPQVMPNSQVQGFLVGKQVLAGQMALQKDAYTQNLKSQAQQNQNDRQQAATYGPKLQTTNQAIETTQRALAEAKRQATSAPFWSKVEGSLPGISNFLGTPDAPGNNLIQNALVDTQLAQDALKSGVITDQQAKTLGADIPGIASDRATVLVPFLERRLEALQRYQQFQQTQYDKANPTPPQGFATSGTSNVSRSATPSSAPSGNGGGILSRHEPVRGNWQSYIQ